MKQILDGTLAIDGLMEFPNSADINAWKTWKQCKNNRGDLLPYFFDPNSNLLNESLIRTLLGEIMIGIDNTDKWEQVMGLKVMRDRFPFNGQVKLNHMSLTFFFMCCYSEIGSWLPPTKEI